MLLTHAGKYFNLTAATSSSSCSLSVCVQLSVCIYRDVCLREYKWHREILGSIQVLLGVCDLFCYSVCSYSSLNIPHPRILYKVMPRHKPVIVNWWPAGCKRPSEPFNPVCNWIVVDPWCKHWFICKINLQIQVSITPQLLPLVKMCDDSCPSLILFIISLWPMACLYSESVSDRTFK